MKLKNPIIKKETLKAVQNYLKTRSMIKNFNIKKFLITMKAMESKF